MKTTSATKTSKTVPAAPESGARFRTEANVLVFETEDEAWRAQGKLEAKAKCPSAPKRTVYRVVRMTKKEAAKHSDNAMRYLVCATPWAYRLQQQKRGSVISAGSDE